MFNAMESLRIIIFYFLYNKNENKSFPCRKNLPNAGYLKLRVTFEMIIKKIITERNAIELSNSERRSRKFMFRQKGEKRMLKLITS